MSEIDDLRAEVERLTDSLALKRGDCIDLKARADKAEAEVEDYKQKVETLLSALRGEQGIVLDDGIVLHPCAERNAEKARADKAEAEVERLTAEVDDKSACAKCGCPQDKHHSTKPRLTLQDRPDVESYCDKCGVEDCWHFTGYAPAPDKSACANGMDCGLPASEHRAGICCPPCTLPVNHSCERNHGHRTKPPCPCDCWKRAALGGKS